MESIEKSIFAGGRGWLRQPYTKPEKYDSSYPEPDCANGSTRKMEEKIAER